jgi:ABC-type branched-subunit amino acid transport system ATPase component
MLQHVDPVGMGQGEGDARALMMKPRLLILDEPTLGLAPVILEQLSKALERPYR